MSAVRTRIGIRIPFSRSYGVNLSSLLSAFFSDATSSARDFLLLHGEEIGGRAGELSGRSRSSGARIKGYDSDSVPAAVARAVPRANAVPRDGTKVPIYQVQVLSFPA